MKRATLLLTTLLASMSLSAVSFAGSDKSFSDIDQDGDQNVSQQELQEAGKDVEVSKFDEDNDGVLSQDEYEKAKAEWKEKKQQ